ATSPSRNTGAAPAGATARAALPAGLLAVSGSCTSNGPGVCSIANSGTVGFTATLSPSQNITVRYQAQIGDQVSSGSVLSSTLTISFGDRPPLITSASVAVNCPAAGPGLSFPATSELSAQKAGSVLVYNLYSSTPTNSNMQNTRIAITNTHQSLNAVVHMFFIDGATCTPADSFICLTPN